jgi:hypothetical protein
METRTPRLKELLLSGTQLDINGLGQRPTRRVCRVVKEELYHQNETHQRLRRNLGEHGEIGVSEAFSFVTFGRNF